MPLRVGTLYLLGLCQSCWLPSDLSFMSFYEVPINGCKQCLITGSPAFPLPALCQAITSQQHVTRSSKPMFGLIVSCTYFLSVWHWMEPQCHAWGAIVWHKGGQGWEKLWTLHVKDCVSMGQLSTGLCYLAPCSSLTSPILLPYLSLILTSSNCDKYEMGFCLEQI